MKTCHKNWFYKSYSTKCTPLIFDKGAQLIQWKNDSINILKQLDIYMQKKKKNLVLSFTSHTNNRHYLKVQHRLNYKIKNETYRRKSQNVLEDKG